MERGFRGVCMACRWRKVQRAPRFGSPPMQSILAANLVGPESAGDTSVVQQNLAIKSWWRFDLYTAGQRHFSRPLLRTGAVNPTSLGSFSQRVNATLLGGYSQRVSKTVLQRTFSSNANNGAETPSQFQQYLDVIRLKAAAHLENIPKRAYLRSLENVLKAAPELEGSVEGVMRRIEEMYKETLKKHQGLAKDSRGASHLQMACLALSSYRTLLPYFAHNRAVTADLIRGPIGAAAADTLDFISRFVLFLSFDKFAHVSRGLEYLKRDFGASFEMEERKAPGFHGLKVKRCLYNTFFELEGEPELTRLFCAFDKMWFDHIHPRRHGIEFSRPSTLADGASFCSFEVKRL